MYVTFFEPVRMSTLVYYPPTSEFNDLLRSFRLYNEKAGTVLFLTLIYKIN